MTTSLPSVAGARAEAAVAAALVRAGKAEFLPAFAAHSRIDLVYEDDCALVRVQCKAALGTASIRACAGRRT